MKKPEDPKTFQALERFDLRCVPKAGHLELETFHDARTRHRLNVLLFGTLSSGLLTFLIMAGSVLPAVALVILSGALAATSIKSFYSFSHLTLASGTRLELALPEGATEATALLEDALHKEMRNWNQATADWNVRVRSWKKARNDFERLRAHPSEDDFEWTPVSLEERRLSLAGEEDALTTESKTLMRRREVIRRKLDQLAAAFLSHDDPGSDR